MSPIPIESVFAEALGLERQTPEEPGMALVHVRALYHRMSEIAIVATEERCPGFHALLVRLITKEAELVESGKAADA